jgi:hypothetical protein
MPWNVDALICRNLRSSADIRLVRRETQIAIAAGRLDTDVRILLWDALVAVGIAALQILSERWADAQVQEPEVAQPGGCCRCA